MNTTTTVQKRDASEISFVPFGGSDPIKMSLQIVQKIVAVPTKSGKTCSDRDGLKFLALCQAQRLNPFAGDCFLVGYDKFDKNTQTTTPVFSLITAHVAFLKRAETSQDYEGMESGIIIAKEDETTVEREGDYAGENENVVGGWARVYRKGRKPTYRRLALAAMRPNYPTPFWEGAKAPGQIVKCAEADALRSTFPTLLGGLYHGGEIIEIASTREPASLPTHQLVEVIPADVEQQPQQQQVSQPEPRQAQTGESTPQDELAEVVTSNNYTFDNFKQWAEQSGNIPNMSAMGSFNDIPSSLCLRWLKAKAGLLKGITATVKGVSA